MKVLKFWFFLALASLFVMGCGKKSGLEGKVVDGRGQPLANVKVVASQLQPIQGYEQFEATTGSDGTFRFGKLFPTSEYALLPWSDAWANMQMMTVQYDPTNLRAQFDKGGWTTDRKMTVQSGSKGEALVLPAPMMVKPAITTVEGKVVDDKGQPPVNLKIVAKQVQPMKGYEQFETTTGADGIFRFEKLFPASHYVLAAQADDFFSEETTLQTGQEEQTVNLPSQWAVRFMFSKGELIVDFRTGLMWVPAPDRDITWDQADNFAQNLRAGGFSDWRLPSRQELGSLYNPSSSNKVHPSFHVKDKWVWTAELSGSSYAWTYCFTSSGIESPEIRSHYGDYKVLAVRFRK